MHKMLYRGVCVASICMAAHAFLAAAPFPHATPMSCCLDMLPRYYGFGVGVGGCHPWRWWPESGRHHAAAMGEVGKKKGVGVAKWGCLGYFFAWESTELLGTPSQMHRHVDNNLISQLTTTRVGWRWVDSRGLELPSQIFQTNFIKTNFSNEFHQNENKCFVAFGVVGERRVGAERVKFNLGVHGCF